MKYVLGVFALIYLIFPNLGLIELLPDPIPFVGHLDELAATFLLTRVFNEDDGTEAAPSWFMLVAFIILGGAGLIYLIFPTAGVVELIPDAIPIAGNLDEMVASMFLFMMTHRIDLATRVKSPNNNVMNQPMQERGLNMSQDVQGNEQSAAVEAPVTEVVASDVPDGSAMMGNPNLSQTNIYQRNNTACFQFFAGFAVVVLACGGVFAAIIGVGGNALGNIFNFNWAAPGNASVELTRPIVTGMSRVGQLVTAEAQFTIDEVRVNYQGGLLNAEGFGMTFEVDSELSAGFDLRNQDAFTVTRRIDNVYVVTLPMPELTQCSIIDVDIEDRSTRVLVNPTEQDMEQLARYVAMDQIINEALEQGFFEEAMLEGRIVATDLVREIVGEDVVVQVDFAPLPDDLNVDTIRRDNTCVIETPTRFQYDPTEEVWRKVS